MNEFAIKSCHKSFFFHYEIVLRLTLNFKYILIEEPHRKFDIPLIFTIHLKFSVLNIIRIFLERLIKYLLS